MENESLIFILRFFIVLESYVKADVKFSINGDLEGYTCPQNDILMFEENMGKIQCLLLCAYNPSCVNVFHDRVLLQCVCCQAKFLTSQAAPVMNGTLNYQRRKYILDILLTWDQAKVHCEGLGGHLAYIKSEEEQLFIENQVIAGYPYNIWIGASLKGSDEMCWTDNTPVSDSFAKWAENEPNFPLNEKCVILFRSNRDNEWTWHSDKCEYTHRSLCEFE